MKSHFLCLVCLLMLICPVVSQAQDSEGKDTAMGVEISHSRQQRWHAYIGCHSGVAENFLLTNITNRSGQEYNPRPGFFLAFPFQYRWLWCGKFELGIGTDLSFIQKSYELDRTDGYSNFYQHTRNDYIQLPVTANLFYKTKKFTSLVSAGIYGAYWMDSHLKGVIPTLLNTSGTNPYEYSYNEKYAFNNKIDQRLEWGWHVGAGESYKIAAKYTAFLKVDFYQSLNSQQKVYMIDQVPRYNKTYIFSLGILKQLGHEKK